MYLKDLSFGDRPIGYSRCSCRNTAPQQIIVPRIKLRLWIPYPPWTITNSKLSIKAVSDGPSSYYHRPMVVIPKHYSFHYLYNSYIWCWFLVTHKCVESISLWLTNQPQSILPFHYVCLAQQVCKIPNGTPLHHMLCHPALPCRCSNLWLLSHVLFWMAHCLSLLLYRQQLVLMMLYWVTFDNSMPLT